MSERGWRCSEALELMIQLWTEDEVTHHGRFFHVSGAKPTAQPFQRPYPKIWLAGMSNPEICRVGREGHTLLVGPVKPQATIRQQVELYHETLAENGRPVPEEMAIVREFFSAPTCREALEKASEGFKTKYRVYNSHGFQGADQELTNKMTGDLETLMDDTFIVGSPKECVEQIAGYREMGSTQVSLRLFYPDMDQKEVMEHIELVGKEVLTKVHVL